MVKGGEPVKKIGIMISICIHLVYAAVSGMMFLGLWDSLENGGTLSDAVPEGIGAVGLILVVLMGAMIFMVLLLFCISVAAVLFEICDLIFDKRGFAFAYGLISFGFLLFFGSALFDTVVSAITEGTIATLWQSGELYFYIALTLSALIPSLVGAKRMIKSKRS